MHRRSISLCLALAALTGLSAPGAVAPATAATAKAPTITRVTPMRLRVGSTVVIRGRNFSSRRTRNTVIFRTPSGRSAFIKPSSATTRKLVIKIPRSMARLLTPQSSRFKLRVLTGRKFSKWTPSRLSPVFVGTGTPPRPVGVAPGSGPGAAATGCGTNFDDGDLLSAGEETQIGTDQCRADTDGDGMADGWEYYAAKDLNIKAVPYPGKRPFPNALDPSDAGVDFDGDGLLAREEYRAWRATGSSFVLSKLGDANLESTLGYSDGTKFSRSGEAPAVPAWKSSSYGLSNPAQPFPATFNLHGDAAWRDDERDADSDGLSNWLESERGPRNGDWGKGFYANTDRFEPIVEPWRDKAYCGYRPGHFEERPFASLDLTDSDVDGDSLLDGEDDQDDDDVNNITEFYEFSYDLDGNGNAFCGWAPGVMPSINVGGTAAPVNPWNPCVPNPSSRTCPDRIPF